MNQTGHQSLVERLGAEEMEVRIQTILDVKSGAIPMHEILTVAAAPEVDALPRAWALIAISQVKPAISEEVRLAVSSALSSNSPTVRRATISALGALEDTESIPMIEKCLTDHSEDPSAWFDDDVTVAQRAQSVLDGLRCRSTAGRTSNPQ